MDTNKLVKKLKSYGANLDVINERFINDMDFYAQCLTQYLNDGVFAELDEALKNKEYEKAFESAHMLKGTSVNMELLPMYDAVCVLVEALRAKQYDHLDKQYKDVMKELAKVKKLVE